MKSYRYVIAAVLLGAIALTASTTQTSFTGVLTDSMCTRKHMIAGVKDADCVRECVKGGAKYVVAAEGKSYTLSGDKTQFDKLAGRKITVRGTLKGSTLQVGTVTAAQ